MRGLESWKKRENAQAAAERAERTDEYDRAAHANIRRPERGAAATRKTVGEAPFFLSTKAAA